MSTNTTIPTILDVQSQIHNLPDRPAFMLAADVAKMFETSPSNFMRQVRKHQDQFTPDMMIELSPSEYREQLCFQSTTAERKRTDLAQYGFTEQGVMMAATLMRSKRAKQMLQVIVSAFIKSREEMMNAMRRELAIDRETYIEGRVIRQRIMMAVDEGWSYTDLRQRFGYSNPQLTTEIQAMRTRGYFPVTALPVPQYVLRKLAENKAWLDVHAEDTRQLLLGLEG